LERSTSSTIASALARVSGLIETEMRPSERSREKSVTVPTKGAEDTLHSDDFSTLSERKPKRS